MNAWALIHGTPARQFTQTIDALPFVNPKLATHQILLDAGTIKATTGTENASVTLTLDNRLGQCTRLFADPPLGARVTVYGDAVAQFVGTITQIDLSTIDCKVTVQA